MFLSCKRKKDKFARCRRQNSPAPHFPRCEGEHKMTARASVKSNLTASMSKPFCCSTTEVFPDVPNNSARESHRSDAALDAAVSIFVAVCFTSSGVSGCLLRVLPSKPSRRVVPSGLIKPIIYNKAKTPPNEDGAAGSRASGTRRRT